WQAEVERQITVSEYGVRRSGDRFVATNRAQRLEADFAASGSEFSSTSGRGTVHVRPVALRRGGDGDARSPAHEGLGGCNTGGAPATRTAPRTSAAIVCAASRSATLS